MTRGGKVGRLAILGSIFGLIGLATCFSSTQVQAPTPPPHQTVFHTAKNVIKVTFSFNAQAPEKTPAQKQYEIELHRSQNFKRVLRLSGGFLGLLALSFGLASFLREDNRKAVAIVVGLGISCIAFEYVIMGIMVVTTILLVFIVASFA